MSEEELEEKIRKIVREILEKREPEEEEEEQDTSKIFNTVHRELYTAKGRFLTGRKEVLKEACWANPDVGDVLNALQTLDVLSGTNLVGELGPDIAHNAYGDALIAERNKKLGIYDENDITAMRLLVPELIGAMDPRGIEIEYKAWNKERMPKSDKFIDAGIEQLRIKYLMSLPPPQEQQYNKYRKTPYGDNRDIERRNEK